MGWARRLTPRAEKTLRLVAVCLVAAVLGIIAVILDSEAVGYASMGLVLAGILVGPLIARHLFRGGPPGGKAPPAR
ncbi:MAG TPA: hypothetical protein VK904_04960 [Miltoncostaeaceae bacterium]|nr:hypothetical protein [Miltoncostaeaceae bacterium]